MVGQRASTACGLRNSGVSFQCPAAWAPHFLKAIWVAFLGVLQAPEFLLCL